MKKLAVAITAVVALQLLVAGPALARHSTGLRHQPPPAAAAARNFNVVAVVEGCALFCGWITVEAHYVAPNGKVRVVRHEVPSFPPVRPIALAIPARHVRVPAITYWLEAFQEYCQPFALCHDSYVRTPARGAFTVPVF